MLIGLMLWTCVPAIPESGLLTAQDEANVISSAIGKPVVLSHSLRKEVLFVRRSVGDWKNELTAVAIALHATVAREGNVIYIVRASKDLDEAKKVRSAERLGWIRSALQQIQSFRDGACSSGSLVDQIMSQISLEDAGQKKYQNGEGPPPTSVLCARNLLPSQVLLEGVMRQVGLEHIAENPINTAEVFESHPCARARLLPHVANLVDSYKGTISKISDAEFTNGQRQALAKYPGMEVLLNCRCREASVSDVRLRVESGRTTIRLTLDLYDIAGTRLDSVDMIVRRSGRLIQSRVLAEETLGNPNVEFCAIPDSAQSMVDFIESSSQPKPIWFMHPDKVEPLSILVAPAVRALVGKDKGACSVVDVSDEWFRLAADSTRTGRLNLTAFKENIDEWSSYQLIGTPGYTVRRPFDPEIEEASRIDRAQLAGFMQDFQAYGWVRPEVVGRLVHRMYPARSALLGDWWMKASLLSPRPSNQGALATSIYNLLGSIPDVYLRRLRAGETCTAGEMGVSAALQAILDEDVLRTNDNAESMDRYCHPSELYGTADVSSTPISISFSNERLSHIVNDPHHMTARSAFGIPSSFSLVPTAEISIGLPRQLYVRCLVALD